MKNNLHVLLGATVADAAARPLHWVYDEKKLPDHLKDHALFIAYAPAENPRLAIAIIVENGGHGGSTAGPIAKKIFDYYLTSKNHK